MIDVLSCPRAIVGAAAVAVAVVAASAGSAASAPAEQAAKPAAPTKPAPAVKADRDGDKLFDDLEARLAGMSSGDELSVLVRLSASASNARVDDLSRRVGGFATTHRFAVVDAFAARVNKGQAIALTRVPWVVHVEENYSVRDMND